MIDFYETSTHQGKSCRVHSDCDTNVGQNDGFCDSFIGYKCSTKCTTDSQCMPSDSSFTYVCRNDGRCAPNTFETVWRINQNNESIVIPLIHAQKCQFKIKWGDNTSIQEVTDCSENLVHKYTHSGDYHVKITGTLYGWHTSSNTNTKDQNADKLIEVVSFGPIGLNGYSGDPNKNQFSFANATNLTKLSQVDIPDASLLTSTKGMFLNAKSFNYPIGNWDTSNVTDMSGTFNNAQSFNQDISRWNTSKVTTMDSMFANAYVFNQKLNTWNTSKVTNMANLFNGAKTFNQDLSNWDTSNVTNMSYMFSSANAFDQDISNWHTSQVTNMLGLFSNAFVFNQNISKWDTSKVTNMSYMFFNAVAFNQDISYWDISKLTNWDQIFCNCGLSDPFKDKIQTNWNKTNNSIKDLLSCN